MRKSLYCLLILSFALLLSGRVVGQLSPGELSKYHEHLEGLSNCTQCHDLGKKVTNQKCLECHTEIADRIKNNKGYHVSDEVKNKDCFSCHSDHHGRDFEIVRFKIEDFEHDKTGYKLEGAHTKKKCSDCHQSKNIQEKSIREKKYSYLGLNSECLSCHTDYHQNTMSKSCLDCHDHQAFKPAPKFIHDKTEFPLRGKHKDVDCEKCHKIETVAGEKFQKFKGIEFASCTSCHEDVHKNKFGQNCTKCHSEQSFHVIKKMDDFDHSSTGFDLIGKHQSLTCKSCHKTNYTKKLAHNRCSDCHTDYHKGEFDPKKYSDCNVCHDENGFDVSSFEFDQHQKTSFPLDGSHLATPCFACHQKENRWTFRNIGTTCNDCHDNIHDLFMDAKYYPENKCTSCHQTDLWKRVEFDHVKTGYELEGKHKEKSCRDCHFVEKEGGKPVQRFSSLNSECKQCHTDKHYGQFEVDGKTDCLRCHGYIKWKEISFNHDNTKFPLDGKHKNVACEKCHKPKQEGQVVFTEYKIKEFKCEDCH